MEIDVAELEPGVTEVTLAGRLDVEGSAAIELRFSAMAGASRGMLVGLAGVTFIASIGVRTLLAGARIVTRRGGRFLLLEPTPEVEHVLVISGVTDLMPIVRNRTDALVTLGPSA